MLMPDQSTATRQAQCSPQQTTLILSMPECPPSLKWATSDNKRLLDDCLSLSVCHSNDSLKILSTIQWFTKQTNLRDTKTTT
ncbi:hypothetical protein BaRGS_00027750 [Batillaria attramentaria]|uniref:Uncharacterized protein n=1 Tax=Batillaria attramentaria TaxID=370345 RepID=A0ABD0K1Z3_9CAEN